MINNERIMYRERDLDNNVIRGLRRGSAGTAISPHIASDLVYNVGSDALVPFTAVSGSFDSFLKADVIIDGENISSIIADENDNLEVVNDVMYIQDVQHVSRLLWNTSAHLPSGQYGEIILDNYIIHFTVKDVDNDLISGITVSKILRCNDGTPSDPDMIECPAAEYNTTYSIGEYLYNYGKDESFYVNPEAPLADQTSIQANFLRGQPIKTGK